MKSANSGAKQLTNCRNRRQQIKFLTRAEARVKWRARTVSEAIDSQIESLKASSEISSLSNKSCQTARWKRERETNAQRS